jgi:tetratricopeptide (TPR) repeat protein
VAQGKLEEALKAYRDGLAIAERLAAFDRSNTRWQRDLSVWYNKVGDVLVAQGELDEALKAYRDGLALRERLAASDRSNMQWQREVAVSHFKLATVFEKLGNFAEALAELHKGRNIIAALVDTAPGVTQFKEDLAWLDSEIARLERRVRGSVKN